MSRQPFTILLALLLACDSPTRSDISLVVATDQSSYLVPPDASLATLEFSVENTGRVNLEIPRCGSHLAAFVDGRVGSRWQVVGQYGTICPAVYDMTPLTLAPGERARSSITLAPGIYRLRVPHAVPGQPADAHTAASNAFAISDTP